MRIGVEASRANRAERTGVEWYACHVLRELAALPAAADHDWTAYTESPLRPDLRAWLPGWNERVLRWPPKYLWTQVRLSWEMHQDPPDTLFIPAHVLPRIRPKRTVVTVHDVGFRRYPQLYKPIQVAYHEITTREIVASDATILTVSEFSKNELIELYGAPANRIVVTPLGLDQARYVPQSDAEVRRVRSKYRLDRPFVLFVGRLEDKKNVHRLVQAFCAAAEGTEFELVLAGLPGRGWGLVQRWLKTHPGGARVRVLGYLPEEDKPALTTAAAWYVQPSFYEGFGLPVLEAMACGTPVLSSTAGSLPEVVGSARAVFFDPNSFEAMVAAFRRAFDCSDAERRGMVAAGLEHVPAFTWRRTAESTLPALVG